MFNRVKPGNPSVGDLFLKAADNSRHVWIVARTFVHVDGILHAVLSHRDQPREIITVSVPALADPALFRRVAV